MLVYKRFFGHVGAQISIDFLLLIPKDGEKIYTSDPNINVPEHVPGSGSGPGPGSGSGPGPSVAAAACRAAASSHGLGPDLGPGPDPRPGPDFGVLNQHHPNIYISSTPAVSV